MLHVSFYQQSLLHVDPDVILLGPRAFERHLRDMLPQIVSADDFRDFYAEDGTKSCCPLVLTGMLLLQARHNVPDDEVVLRAHQDLSWRYALGLEGLDRPPGVTSLRRFRTKLREKRGDDFLHKRTLALAVDTGALHDIELQTADSTNTDCRGAVIDTFNLVATGIGQVVRTVARAFGSSVDELAQRWGLAAYLARSVKGAAAIDWSSEPARNKFLTEEIKDADRLPELVKALNVKLPPDVDEALALLAKVSRQDVETLPDGTFRIAQGTAAGRIISITDPEARHGRKSSSKVINGFKTHIMGTIETQFVTGIVITDAGTHDARPTSKLIQQTETAGVKPKEVVSDAAYGTGANLRACAEEGVKVLTKLATPSHKGGNPKRAFKIDLDAGTVTCPAGQVTSNSTQVKGQDDGAEVVAKFRFDRAICQACPMAKTCNAETAKGGGRTITLSGYERELQETISFNNEPRAKDVLRSRSAVERLISHLVRMGMRQARFFGMHMVQFQAFMAATAYNLQRLMTLLGAQPR